jgi:circadian clock protein KaiC
VFGLEMHLLSMHKAIEEFEPQAIVVDPISSLVSVGNPNEVKSMLVRLFDYLKMKGITGVMTSLSTAAGLEETTIGISSLIDTWFQLRDIEIDGERTRGLYVVKSRGMGHSNQVREFLISSDGIDLVPVVVGPRGVLTGSARLNQEWEAKALTQQQTQDAERRRRTLDRRKRAVEAQIEALRAELAAEEDDALAADSEMTDRASRLARAHAQMGASRSSGSKRL